MKHRRIAHVFVLAILAACGGDSTGPNVAESGTMTFAYTGGGGGSFLATGGIAPTASPATLRATAWAAGGLVTGDKSTFVSASTPRTGGLVDMAALLINRQTIGEGTISDTCAPTATAACNALILIVGSPASSSPPTSICFLESGTITLSAISATNAIGTFSGAGICIDTSAPSVETAFTVTNGSFSVPLTSTVASLGT